MKKKLEADLISIAHRVLKLKGKEDTILLHQEAQKLYEKLSVLRFYEENINILQKEISIEQLESKLENPVVVETILPIIETPESKAEVVVVKTKIQNEEEKSEETVTPINEEPKVEIETQEEETIIAKEELAALEDTETQTETITITEEEIEEVATPAFIPSFEFTPEEEEEKHEVISVKETIQEVNSPVSKQISLEDFLDSNYKEPEFVKVDDVPSEITTATEPVFEAPTVPDNSTASTSTEPKVMSLNDTLLKGINVGLNDRIAFVKHLFGGSNEDFNRVISQLNTINTFAEAKNFVEDLVKPDYNNWKNKEDYAERFMEIVEKKFN